MNKVPNGNQAHAVLMWSARMRVQSIRKSPYV